MTDAPDALIQKSLGKRTSSIHLKYTYRSSALPSAFTIASCISHRSQIKSKCSSSFFIQLVTTLDFLLFSNSFIRLVSVARERVE